VLNITVDGRMEVVRSLHFGCAVPHSYPDLGVEDSIIRMGVSRRLYFAVTPDMTHLPPASSNKGRHALPAQRRRASVQRGRT